MEKGWEQPVRRYGATGEPAKLGIQKNLTDTARVNNKLNTIIIPRVEFRDATLREAVNFLREQAVENDPATEGERGINIVLPPSVVVQRPPPPPAGVSPAPAGLPLLRLAQHRLARLPLAPVRQSLNPRHLQRRGGA